MNPSPSIAGRAVLAIVLMVGFYLLALGLAFGLLYIPYAEVTYANRLHIKLAILCVIGALAILWSVLPRFDKFEAPGPALTPDRHPRLFNEIEGVAKGTNQTMPAEVYVVPDVNAWVTQRGGIMGFSSRRVMGVGLPLMRMLTCSQFRAVLAHEFGHYHGGDTKLGPWVYKTRNAIGRTVSTLAGSDGQGSILQWPFIWYGKMFLRITHAVSRRQEFVADELAARTVGSKPLIDGLRAVHGAAPAYEAYWVNECLPVLRSGFRPPMVEGFEKFLRTASISAAVDKQLEQELKMEKADPYDTHPPLKERIAAVSALPPGSPAAEDPPASSLLEDLPSLEKELLVSIAGPDAAQKLKELSWTEVAAQVYLPQWTRLAKANAAALSGITPEALPGLAANLKELGARFVDASGQKVDAESAEGLACAVLASVLGVLAVQKGGQPNTSPGEAVSVAIGSTRFEPFAVAEALASRKMSAEAWQRQCAELGISGADLGAAVVL